MNPVLLANISSQLMLFLATVIATGLLMRRIAKRSSRSRASGPLSQFARESKANALHSLDPRPAAGRNQIEMYELARDVIGELDTKMRVLQLLIDQARRESDRLEALLDKSRRENALSEA